MACSVDTGSWNTHPRVPVRAEASSTAESDSTANGVTAGSTPHMSLFPGRKMTAARAGNAVALNQLEGMMPASQHRNFRNSQKEQELGQNIV